MHLRNRIPQKELKVFIWIENLLKLYNVDELAARFTATWDCHRAIMGTISIPKLVECHIGTDNPVLLMSIHVFLVE